MVSPEQHEAGQEGLVWHLRLYLAGNAPNSVRARLNLQDICRDLLPDQVRIEIIDVLENPLAALNDGVFVTPTLRKLAPPPVVQIFGDLSDGDSVRVALGMGRKSS